MRLTLLLPLCLGLSACGTLGSLTSGSGSAGSVGSIGSFGSGSLGGGSKSDAPKTRAELRPLVPPEMVTVTTDQRTAAATIQSAELTRAPGGRLLRATGTARVSGTYNAELVEVARDSRSVTFELRMNAQAGTGVSPRVITAARLLTPKDLGGRRSVRVVSAGGSRSLSF